MGKGNGAKAWATVLMTVMVLSAFGGLGGLAGGANEVFILENIVFDKNLDDPPIANAGPDQLVPRHTVVTFDGSFSTDTDTKTVTVVDIFDIDITPAMNSNGWILMSFPNKISGHPFSVVVDALDEGGGFVQWDIIQRYDPFNPLPTPWKTSAKFWPPSLNTFNYVDNTMGFWLHISDYGDYNFQFAGPLPTSGEQVIIPMRSGWNLIGWPCGSMLMEDVLLGSSWDGRVEVYDPTDPYRLRPANPSIEYFYPGGGYWVYMTMDEDLWIWNP